MANLMGVTNPVPNYDGPNNNRTVPTTVKPNDTQIQNIPDPTRVGRPDARTDQSGADDALQSTALRYDSNLQVFLQNLREAPDLGAEILKAVTWLRGLAMTPGLQAGLAEEISEILKLFRMDGESFRQFFLTQMESGNRFSGPLLSLLRQAYQTIPSEGVRQDILGFLKRYSDFSSTDHIGRTMMQILKQLPDYLPKSWHDRLLDMTARLENGLEAGTRGENLKLLQGEIVPYLGNYVERTHDLGTARSLLRLLVLNITRYENGGEEGLLSAFRQLSGYGDVLEGLNRLDDASLLKLLRENPFTQASQQDVFSERLASLAQYALRGECGSQVQEAFQEIIRAILINESVYMPLRHGLLPMEWDGKMSYGEFWVDPDAQDEEKGSEAGKNQEGKIQFLFKMDIQNLGFLEMALGAIDSQVDLSVYGPETMSRHGEVIAQDIREILKSHGLDGKSIRVIKEEKPLAITDVFPHLFEGKRSVNVKI